MALNDAQLALVVEFQDIGAGQIAAAADRWAAEQISLQDFEGLFKQELKDVYIATVWAARGTTQVSQRDYGLAGRRLRDQYQFMHGLFTEIEAGELSLAQIKNRGRLFARSSRQVAEQVALDQPGLPRLPAYPADGSSICKTNDRCTLREVQVENGWDIYWQLNPAEHCATCRRRAAKSPLMVRFGRVVNPEAWR